jgi:hypothetical protein
LLIIEPKQLIILLFEQAPSQQENQGARTVLFLSCCATTVQ